MPRKTFANGFPLPASDLNTYLMDQSVQTYASAAARTSAIATPIEGQVTYLEDTNLLYVWDGSAWTSVGQIADGSITNAKLANSSVSINGNSVALGASTTLDIGRNKIINGGMDFWQRGTSFPYSVSQTIYTADRWYFFSSATTTTGTVSQQSFTPGAAPVSGYEAQYFLRVATTTISGANIHSIWQKIEDVRTFAGQTATVSFWAKADASRSFGLRYAQQFGTGGSTEVVGSIGTFTATTSWQRFTATVTLPSISGKTIGAGNVLSILYDMPQVNGSTFDVWGVQVEAGSVATPFQRASSTLQGELAACQRYYEKSFDSTTAPSNGSTTFSTFNGITSLASINTAYSPAVPNATVSFKVTKRATPTVTLYGNSSGHWGYVTSSSAPTFSANSLVLTNIGNQSFGGNQQVVNNAICLVVGHWVAESEL